MKRSNIFSGMEQVLNNLEDKIESARTCYQESVREYKELQESEEEISKWDKEYHEDRIELNEVTLHLFESAYNYVYENFHKLTKDL